MLQHRCAALYCEYTMLYGKMILCYILLALSPRLVVSLPDVVGTDIGNLWDVNASDIDSGEPRVVMISEDY